jgi:hypothetical protein
LDCLLSYSQMIPKLQPIKEDSLFIKSDLLMELESIYIIICLGMSFNEFGLESFDKQIIFLLISGFFMGRSIVLYLFF